MNNYLNNEYFRSSSTVSDSVKLDCSDKSSILLNDTHKLHNLQTIGNVIIFRKKFYNGRLINALIYLGDDY